MLQLRELSVVLVADSNNPSILNPDFLKIHGIVSHESSLKDPPICTPAFSQVTFADGITVRADPARVTFQHSSDQLDPGNVRCIESARRYIAIVPPVPYTAIGINLKGYRIGQEVEMETLAGVLVEKGAWTAFQGVKPKLRLNAVYDLEDKRIAFAVSEQNEKTSTGVTAPILSFDANIHRDVQVTNQLERIKNLETILTSWAGDLADFEKIAENYAVRIMHAKSR